VRGVAILGLLLGLSFVGMLVMFISGARAKSWLSKNADPEHSRLRGVALVMRYAEIRAYHGESTTLATAFWIGAAIWGLGVIGICTFLAVVGD